VGVLAPFDRRLDDSRPAWMQAMTFHAGGLGIRPAGMDRAAARRAIGVAEDVELVVVMSGAGGSGVPLAPLTMAARAVPEALWLTVGRIAGEWHETGAANLRHRGWVDTPDAYLAAADVIVGQPGNTLVHQVLALGTPFVAIPEWRYFGEQEGKARALMREGVAHACATWPSTPQGWRDALAAARACDAARARSMVAPDAAARAAGWLETLAASLWHRPEGLAAAE
jgi:UDP-N-acetylglucosamine:LPS N-acetylglucosamine transferase